MPVHLFSLLKYSKFSQNSPGILETCNEQTACGMEFVNPVTPNPGTNYSLITYPYPDSWTEQYSLICSKSVDRIGGKTLLLIVNAITSFLALALSDYIGRRNSVFLANIAFMGSFTLSFFSKIFLVKLLGLAIACGVGAAYAGLYAIVINECTSNNYIFLFLVPSTSLRSSTVTLDFVAFGIAEILVNLLALLVLNSTP